MALESIFGGIVKPDSIRNFIMTVILFLVFVTVSFSNTENPHGKIAFTCDECHSTDDWKELLPVLKFDHGLTGFPIEGHHGAADCRDCHVSLEFGRVQSLCSSCHADIHENQFGNTCDECHSPRGWIDYNYFRERHQSSRFPLLGPHTQLDCGACHREGNYVNTPLECSGCHMGDYNGSMEPVHLNVGFSTECGECHDPAASVWEGVRFEHTAGFPLTGGHNIGDCNPCHQTQLSSLSSECFGCHLAEYQSAGNPDHQAAQISHSCQECHTNNMWSPSFFNHQETGFPLMGAHLTQVCQDCHQGGQFAGLASGCIDCHQTDYESVEDPSHTAAQFDTDCLECHSQVSWTPSSFEHSNTNFILNGAHIVLNCEDCHQNGQFSGVGSECIGCHQADYETADNPGHLAGQFSLECLDCHNEQAWTPSTFDHAATDYPLLGAHVTVSCDLCHVNGQFAGTPSDCWSCHEDNYNAAADPDHAAGLFNQDCTECHSLAGWTPATFNHDNTGFALTGAHVTVSCDLCHVNGQFAGTPSDCWSCHQPDYNSAENPDHAAGQISHTCDDCHTTTGWVPSTFDHQQVFLLEGAHVSLDCQECHINGQFGGTPTDCFGCHEADYNEVSDPDHLAGQFSYNCLICHTQKSWEPSTLDHNQTAFPLTGAHVSVSCELCHMNGQFAGTPDDCWSCHEDNYNSSTNPDHVAAQFPAECEACHTTEGWTPATFDHDQTGYTLTGAHVSASCELCHINGQFGGTPDDCWSCHEDNYNAASDPDHAAAQFPAECEACHTTEGWTPATFDHDQTGYTLTGAHVSASCELCHINGQFGGTPDDCWSCHEDNYNAASDPDHAAAQFPAECEACHTTEGWTPATFDHDQTGYTLTGAHVSASCELCHINGQFGGTPDDCWSCHEDNYNAASDPDHAAAQFPAECEACHTTEGWTPATFDHDQTGYVLTGIHIVTPCSECHIGGQYSGTPTECFFCHEDDYNSSTNPNHLAASFPPECELCHSTNNWLSNYNHDQMYFPIYTGEHHEAWNTCSDCHPVPANFSIFTCIDCHEHNQPDMDDDHDEVTGYVYESNACYACHPDGGEDSLPDKRKKSKIPQIPRNK